MDYNREPLDIISPYSYEETKKFVCLNSRNNAYIGYTLIVVYTGAVIFDIVMTGYYDHFVWGMLVFAAAIFNIALSRGMHFSRKLYNRSHATVAKGFRFLFRNDDFIFINLLQSDEKDVTKAYREAFKTDFGEDEPVETETELQDGEQPVSTIPYGWNRMSYTKIIKLVESDTAFYAYIGRNAAFIVSKVNMTHEQTHAFVKLMEDKLGKRFQRPKSK